MRPSALDDNSYCTSVLHNLSTLSDSMVIKVKNLNEKKIVILVSCLLFLNKGVLTFLLIFVLFLS